MALKQALIRHDVVVGKDKILIELVVEGLTGDLDTDTEDDLYVDDLLAQGRIQDPQVPLPRLLDRIILLVLRRHNLIQMDLIVEEVVVLETTERFQHLFDLVAHILDQGLVLEPQTALLEGLVLLRYPLLLLVHDGNKDSALVVLRLHFLCFEVDDLAELIHTVAAGEDLAQDLTRELLHRVLEVLDREVGRLQIGLERVWLVVASLSTIVLALLLEELGVRHHRVVLRRDDFIGLGWQVLR